MKLFFTLLSFLVINCDDSENLTLQETKKQEIDKLKVEIKAMADASICSEEFTCYSVGIGAKPCGGFWEYIVYSSSIDVETFLAKIQTLNKTEAEYNQKYSVQSDCFLAMPPSSISCVEGKCTAIFE